MIIGWEHLQRWPGKIARYMFCSLTDWRSSFSAGQRWLGYSHFNLLPEELRPWVSRKVKALQVQFVYQLSVWEASTYRATREKTEHYEFGREKSGTPKSGLFGVLQHCLKFDNDRGAGIWIRSKNLGHGTLPFQSTSSSDFKLGVAIVNKTALHTRIKNGLKEGTSLTFKDKEDFEKEWIS